MPSFESPSLYIDYSRLPPPDVIEEIDFEDLLQVYHEQALKLKPDMARALKLNQSSANVILHAQSYGEMIVRERINAAARAVMLPFAVKNDLTVLGTNMNVPREPTPATKDTPEIPEDDERYRNRVRLSIESFSSGGPAGAYIFHALKAHPGIRDVSAIKVGRGAGVGVQLTVMNTGSDPVPTDEQMIAVYNRIHLPNIGLLTDDISIKRVKKLSTDIVAEVALYPGPDSTAVVGDINKALGKLRDRIAIIGRDLNRSAIFAALNQEGVQGVNLISPAADVVADPTQCAWIESAKLNLSTFRRE